MRILGLVGALFITVAFVATPALAATSYSEAIPLSPGWNIISTPRVLDSHSFSVEETATNFDIYVLNGSIWSTMAGIGQTEFTPLYGYFINNKTGSNQTLTFNYKSGTTPNERLFSRSFSQTGWYSVGVANPTYAKVRGASSAVDANNPSNILSSTQGSYSQLVDFTFDSFASDPDSVAVGNTWSAYSAADANSTKDLRETKGYAVYINVANGLYSGSQNDSIPACADGIDNDGDGKIDLADVGCDYANDDSEFNAIGSLSVNMSGTPASTNMVAGGQGVTFANVVLDATASNEGIRLSTIPLRLTVGGGATVADLTSCQVYDGASALNTGGNVPSSLSSSGTATTFTFDNAFTVTAGTSATLTLKCNVSGSAVGSFTWSISGEDVWNTTGVTSGASISEDVTSGSAGTMSIVAGSLTVTTDPLSPAYTIAAAGSTGVTLGIYKFTATGEGMNLSRIGISLDGPSASSTADDLGTLTFWANSTQIATAQFTGSSRHATSTTISGVTVPSGGTLSVTVKADLAAHGSGQSSHPGALLTVNVDTNGANGNKNTSASGVSSGATINPSGSTDVAGVRVFRTYPTVARSTTGMSSTLIAQSGVDLYRFTVAASSGGNGVMLNKLNVRIATSTASISNGTTAITNLKVYAYTGSDFSTGPVSGYTAGQVVSTIATLVNDGNNSAVLSSPLTIPAGTTYYFRVVGDVSQVAGTTGSAGSVTTKLSGDTAYSSLSTLMGTYADVSGSNLVWSPLSTTASVTTSDADWTNGFNVPGISSGSTDSWTLSK